MIEEEFGLTEITSIDFGIALRSSGERYFVPADNEVQETLIEVLGNTIQCFQDADSEWQTFDLTEDYGIPRKVYLARETEGLGILSSLFDADALDDMADVMSHGHDIGYYFAVFRDTQGRKIIGVRKAVQLKASLNARGRMIRWFDNTLQVVEDDVLKLDNDFDFIIADQNIYILRPTAFEHVAKTTQRISTIAGSRLEHLQQTLQFLDLSELGSMISKRTRCARAVCAVSERNDLNQVKQQLLINIASQHGVNLATLPDGRLKPATDRDVIILLEILDARRYEFDLTGGGPIPFRATGRQRVSLP